MPRIQIAFDTSGSGITLQAKAASPIGKHLVISGAGRLDGASPTIMIANPANVSTHPGFAISLENAKVNWTTEVMTHGVLKLCYDVPVGPLFLGANGRLVGADEGVGEKLATGLPGRWIIFG